MNDLLRAIWLIVLLCALAFIVYGFLFVVFK